MEVSQNKYMATPCLIGSFVFYPNIYMKYYKSVGCWFDYSEIENDG